MSRAYEQEVRTKRAKESATYRFREWNSVRKENKLIINRVDPLKL